jgi:hypothetical protein
MKCAYCDFPHATSRHCPNCGQHQPQPLISPVALGLVGLVALLTMGYCSAELGSSPKNQVASPAKFQAQNANYSTAPIYENRTVTNTIDSALQLAINEAIRVYDLNLPHIEAVKTRAEMRWRRLKIELNARGAYLQVSEKKVNVHFLYDIGDDEAINFRKSANANWQSIINCDIAHYQFSRLKLATDNLVRRANDPKNINSAAEKDKLIQSTEDAKKALARCTEI